jgi:preprotein translocase subunit YajC
MLISSAFAQEASPITTTTAATTTAPAAMGSGNLMTSNMGLMLAMIVLFYVLMIRPQQKRFKEHQIMINSLKVGDQVLTSGGLIAKIVKFTNDKEAIISLADGVEVKAIRSTLTIHHDKVDTLEKTDETPKKAKSKKEKAA